MCPFRKGLTLQSLLCGWDWEHQTYSIREGYRSLGDTFITYIPCFAISLSHIYIYVDICLNTYVNICLRDGFCFSTCFPGCFCSRLVATRELVTQPLEDAMKLIGPKMEDVRGGLG